MRQPGDHLADQTLSAAIDDQLTPDEALQARTHLETCVVCAARVAELQWLVGLLRGLPSLEPPRDFSLGPRLVVDPPNLVRLRRWYGVARASAATLAAAFVFLSAGALYVGSQPAAGSAGLAPKPELASAPAAPPFASPAVRAAAPASAAQPAPASAGQSAPASAAQSAARAKPVASEDATDQVTAATSVRPLPTPVPTFAQVTTQAPPSIAPEAVPVARTDSAAPLRTAAAIVGLLALVGLLATLVVRHRLRAASLPPTE